MAFSVEQNDAYHVGADHDMDFTVKDAAGAAVDITGASPINWEIRSHELSAATVLAKTGSVTDGLNGIFRVSLAAGDSPAVRVYRMQADMTLSSKKTVAAQGSFEVKTKITS